MVRRAVTQCRRTASPHDARQPAIPVDKASSRKARRALETCLVLATGLEKLYRPADRRTFTRPRSLRTLSTL
jgi:hypothetical protein